MNDFELSGGGIILRPIRMEYAEVHLAGDDEENVHWLSGGVGTKETVRNWINRMREEWENNGQYTIFSQLCILHESGATSHSKSAAFFRVPTKKYFNY